MPVSFSSVRRLSVLLAATSWFTCFCCTSTVDRKPLSSRPSFFVSQDSACDTAGPASSVPSSQHSHFVPPVLAFTMERFTRSSLPSRSNTASTNDSSSSGAPSRRHDEFLIPLFGFVP